MSETLAVSNNHSGSHRALLHRPSMVLAPRRLDAIIVPSARTAPYLAEAVRISLEVGCPLVVLCSGYSKVDKVAKFIRARDTPQFVAVDMSRYHPAQLPAFISSTVLGPRLDRRTDLSLKRNTGLALAQMVGWSRILFLDDDIAVPDAAHLRSVATLLDEFDAVGLEVGGQRDNSVVCHAHREAGGFQEWFVGGGALAVSVRRFGSFFPEIYNEDWFFLLDDSGLVPVAEYGEAKQYPYDPFADPERARRQEFGDIIAEGIFRLLDHGHKIDDANSRYWHDALIRRRAFIAEVIAKVNAQSMDPGQRSRMIASLTAAKGRATWITPAMCYDFVQAWKADRVVWADAVDRLPHQADLVGALLYLALYERAIGQLEDRAIGSFRQSRSAPSSYGARRGSQLGRSTAIDCLDHQRKQGHANNRTSGTLD